MFKILNEFVIFLNQYQDYSRFKDCFSIYNLTPFRLAVREREREGFSILYRLPAQQVPSLIAIRYRKMHNIYIEVTGKRKKNANCAFPDQPGYMRYPLT